VTGNSITLKWNASTDNVAVTGYNVYVNDVWYANTTTTTFTHTGLARNTIYKYRISAHDAVPNDSDWTAPLSVRTAKH
jgi:chitodextrinase